MSELNPCPFCKDGGQPDISKWNERGWGGEYEYTAHVSCLSCLASGPIIAGTSEVSAVALAIAAWNQRATPMPDTPDMVRALDDAYEAGRKSAERTCIDSDILIYALDFVSERECSCPYDEFDFQPFGGCEVECGKHQVSTCWHQYFKSKVVE